MTKVTKEDVTAELKAAIKDYFVGRVEEEGETLVLTLVSGQTFGICVSEKANGYA
jgi:hypothetical protein